MRVLVQLFSSLVLVSASSCYLDTTPKAHDVCSEDGGTYLFRFTETKGTCGPLPDVLERPLNLKTKDCVQTITYYADCLPVIRRQCSNYVSEYILTDRDNLTGIAELYGPDCVSYYDITLKLVQGE